MQSGAQIARRDDSLMEQVIVKGDLAKLSPVERSQYYAKVCESVGLNPFTRPFEYITLNGKLTLYARKDATDQLRKLHNVSIQIVSRERLEDVYVVTARATTPDGRADESIGAVSIGKSTGDALCNALMKAETKAKRRATLSLCGMGFLEESEVETVPQARRVEVDEGGEIIEPEIVREPIRSGPQGDGTMAMKQPTASPAQELTKWQSECKAIWLALKKDQHPDFQSSTQMLAHLIDTSHNQGWDIESISGLSSIPENLLEKYASILTDIQQVWLERF